MKPNHVHAGTPEANTPEWREHYDQPEHVGAATCKRCGAAINDLTQHREFHGVDITA